VRTTVDQGLVDRQDTPGDQSRRRSNVLFGKHLGGAFV
jgi:hypothetical protein